MGTEHQLRELRRLLRAAAEQAGWSSVAAIDASGSSATKQAITIATARIIVPVAEDDDLDRCELAGDQGHPIYDPEELGRSHRNEGLPPERGRPASTGCSRKLLVE